LPGAAGLPARSLGEPPSPSEADDTRRAARALVDAGAQLLLFAGGDGTARDLVDALGEDDVPVLGVPAGCKMHSAVYAINPEAAGELLAELVDGGLVALHEAEVRDIDEEAFRAGRVQARHYGDLNVPAEARYLQQVKCGGREVEDLVVTEIAAWVIDTLEPDTYYLVGSGSTVAVVMEQLGLPNTLLGVDIIRNEEVVAADVGADRILEVIGDRPGPGVTDRDRRPGPSVRARQPAVQPGGDPAPGEGPHRYSRQPHQAGHPGRAPLVVDTGDAALDRSLCGLWPGDQWL
jgi:predicted polyphosphate/ATP-dependent NAD kinase